MTTTLRPASRSVCAASSILLLTVFITHISGATYLAFIPTSVAVRPKQGAARETSTSFSCGGFETTSVYVSMVPPSYAALGGVSM